MQMKNFFNRTTNKHWQIAMKYIEGKDELWPLPQSEIDTNSAIIENNPGY